MLIVVAVGLIGNAALLIVVYRIQDTRTIKNFYLSNLVISDAMLLLNAAFQYTWAHFTQPIDHSSPSFSKGIEWSVYVHLVFCISVYGYTGDI